MLLAILAGAGVVAVGVGFVRVISSLGEFADGIEGRD